MRNALEDMHLLEIQRAATTRRFGRGNISHSSKDVKTGCLRFGRRAHALPGLPGRCVVRQVNRPSECDERTN
jgi:hypothetical protein